MWLEKKSGKHNDVFLIINLLLPVCVKIVIICILYIICNFSFTFFLLLERYDGNNFDSMKIKEIEMGVRKYKFI